MIGIIDYGLGNVQAFATIYRRLGIEAGAIRTADALAKADKLILPGVGAFDWAMTRLTQSGLRDALTQRVIEERVPILGVCVGMQIMGDASDEGVQDGLGWLAGRIKRFDASWFETTPHLPHMGWNDIAPIGNDPLFQNLTAPRYYFLHSYFFAPKDDAQIIAQSDYGTRFASALRCDNIVATQFHPEKSHDWGIGLLKNFAEFG